jgi:hypothetical protein
LNGLNGAVTKSCKKYTKRGNKNRDVSGSPPLWGEFPKQHPLTSQPMELKMKPKSCCYTVVENSGYEGECDVRTCFSGPEAAWKWAERYYSADELESLHVQVRRDSKEGSTYEY